MEGLLEMLAGSSESNSADNFESRLEATEALQNFKNAYTENPNGLQVGDFLERSELGEKTIRFPKEKQAAMVWSFLDTPKYDGGHSNMPLDMIIAVALDKENIRFYEVSSHYYKKTNA